MIIAAQEYITQKNVLMALGQILNNMKIYRIANIDSFIAKHLQSWLERVIPAEEIDSVKEKILHWIETAPKEEVDYAMNEGWRKVYDLAIQGEAEKL